jgi:hypothetical protein
MKWLLRFAAWSAVFAVVCWFAMPLYEHVLSTIVKQILTFLLGDRVELETLDLKAPNELGLFAALCLAGRRAPREARRFALLAGLPMIVAAEILLIVTGLVLMSGVPENGPAAEPALRLFLYELRTIPWAVSLLVWLALLGKWELPAPKRAGNPPPAPRR